MNEPLALPAPEANWPSIEVQRQYWIDKERELERDAISCNDWLDEEAQFSNYDNHEL